MNRVPGQPEPVDVEPVDVGPFARDLLDAVESSLPGWAERCLLRRDPTTPPEAIRAARHAVVELVMPELRSLLLADIDEQRGSPLAIVRRAVAVPTALLSSRGVAPASRDAFAVERFPDDLYDLSPAAWSDLDDSVTEPGLRWGAAKAFEHRRRHR